jgi:hypothetical protein
LTSHCILCYFLSLLHNFESLFVVHATGMPHIRFLYLVGIVIAYTRTITKYFFLVFEHLLTFQGTIMNDFVATCLLNLLDNVPMQYSVVIEMTICTQYSF